MELRNKTVLVTGGGVRIGRAICRALAEEGAEVIIHFHRSSGEAARLKRELLNLGVRAFSLRADLSNERACFQLIKKAHALTGRLDILVNNAAVFHKDSVRTLTARNILDEFRPNLLAPLLLTRAFSEVTRTGKIVNLLDRRITGLDSSCIPYLLSKQALAEFTRMAALELAPGITVNAVAPGAILPPPGKGRAYLYDQAGPVPLKRQVIASAARPPLPNSRATRPASIAPAER